MEGPLLRKSLRLPGWQATDRCRSLVVVRSRQTSLHCADCSRAFANLAALRETDLAGNDHPLSWRQRGVFDFDVATVSRPGSHVYPVRESRGCDKSKARDAGYVVAENSRRRDDGNGNLFPNYDFDGSEQSGLNGSARGLEIGAEVDAHGNGHDAIGVRR